MHRWLKILGIVVAVAVVLILGTGLWVRGLITGSLPVLDGEVEITVAVKISDRLG